MKWGNAFKWLSVMIIVLIVAAAIGCGKKETQQPTPTPTAISSPTATAPAEPTGETGTLSGLEGDVQVLRQGASVWETATSGIKIGTGYGLKTGSDGYVLITFFDGSVMELEADSEISVEELSKTSGGSTTIHINQMIGNTLNRVENLVDSSSIYEVETLAGSAVVRGTTERIQVGASGRTCTTVDDEDDAASHSAVFTARGVSQAIGEGFTSCCEPGGIPGSPFYTNPADDPLQFSSDSGGVYSCEETCGVEGGYGTCCGGEQCCEGQGVRLYGELIYGETGFGYYYCAASCEPECTQSCGDRNLGTDGICCGDGETCDGNGEMGYSCCGDYGSSCDSSADCCSQYYCNGDGYCRGGG